LGAKRKAIEVLLRLFGVGGGVAMEEEGKGGKKKKKENVCTNIKSRR
jgi:hypothetical protein